MTENPELYKYIEGIWDVKNRHEIHAMPPQYIFLRVCCFQKGCSHPLCQRGKEGIQMEWFQGGPNVDKIPFPVSDPNQPWRSKDCRKCSGFYAGHFLSPYEVLASKDFFQSLEGSEASSKQIEEVAKQSLLPIPEVHIWLDHLKTVRSNRQRGAMKAAETRRCKHQNKRVTEVTYNCGVCEAVYGESAEAEYWVGCEKCDSWFNGECIKITLAYEPEKHYCSACVS